MKKHRLLLFDEIGRPIRGKALLITITLAGLGIYDQFRPVFGPQWPWLWVACAAAFALWFYYGLFMRRAAIQIRPKYLRLQGPLFGLNISYGRIHTVTSALVSHHYPPNKASNRERQLLERFQGQASVFVELRSTPPNFKQRQWLFPRYLFGTSRPGLLLVATDWLSLSRDIEDGRANWFNKQHPHQRSQNRSLAAGVLDDFHE